MKTEREQLKNQIENNAATLSNTDVLVHYLVEELEQLQTISQRRKINDIFEQSNRLLKLSGLISDILKKATSEQYQIFDTIKG